MSRRLANLVILPGIVIAVVIIGNVAKDRHRFGEVRADSAINVPAGGDLQAALNTARPGDTVLLQTGATYRGNFYLPRRTSNDQRQITLRTSLPAGNALGRVSPDQAASLAKLQSPNESPALRTEPGARFWRVQLVEFRANRAGAGDIIALGDGSGAQIRPDDAPSDLVLDRLYIHGDPNDGQKRGVALNSGRTTISNCYISDIKAQGQDSQAIAGWNGPGDYTIENNYLEAAGENVMFGGSDPAIRDLTPTNIAVRRNTMSKPLEWRDSPWTVKNLFELKNARNVTIEQNLLEHNWEGGQTGFAVLFTVRNEDGACPWCQVENVTFRNNIVRDIAAGVVILGTDDIHPSRQTRNVRISNNLFDGIDWKQWGGNGYWLQLTSTTDGVTIDHNTVIQGASSGIAFIEHRIDQFTFTNNIASHGDYGIIGADHGIGNDSIRTYLPGGTISGNVVAGGDRGAYPPGNFFPSLDELRAQFVDFSRHDFRLRGTSAWVTAGTDHRRIGVDMSQLPLVPPALAPIRRGR